MNQFLAFLMLVAGTALLACPVLALCGLYPAAVSALYLALILGVPSYLVLLARHINPEGNDQ